MLTAAEKMTEMMRILIESFPEETHENTARVSLGATSNPSQRIPPHSSIGALPTRYCARCRVRVNQSAQDTSPYLLLTTSPLKPMVYLCAGRSCRFALPHSVNAREGAQ